MGGNTLTATANYIWKIDTLGSQFKLIADYTRYTSHGDNSYHTTTCAPGTLRDSLYESATGSVYDILTADAGLTRKLPHGLTLRAGLRYTRNGMADDSRYAAQTQGTWLALPEYSYDQHYTEQIGAAYACAGIQRRTVGAFGRAARRIHLRRIADARPLLFRVVPKRFGQPRAQRPAHMGCSWRSGAATSNARHSRR